MAVEHSCIDCGVTFYRVSARGRPRIRCARCSPEQKGATNTKPREKWRRFSHPKACEHCGAGFRGMWHQKYCSPQCHDVAARRRRGANPIADEIRRRREASSHWRICEHCGQKFLRKPGGSDTGRTGRWCSMACRVAASSTRGDREQKPRFSAVHSCLGCAALIAIRKKRCAKCSVVAEEAARSRVKEDKRSALRETVCAQCAKSFKPAHGNAKRFCSWRCGARFYRQQAGGKYRERARRYGVAYEPIKVRLVFDRDGWQCQICGKATPESRRGSNYPNAPELDHRVPLARGGPHSYGNVQCACRACNAMKSDKLVIGQLPLLR